MEEALIKRVMPHSIEAEQSVVGAMLMDKDAITTSSVHTGLYLTPWWNCIMKESRWT